MTRAESNALDDEAAWLAAALLKLQPDDAEAKATQSRLKVYADFQQLLKLAEEGDPAARVRVGIAYYRGQGVAHDPAKAVQWLRKAADDGYPLGLRWFGLMNRNGFGVPKDIAAAAACYERAAQAGHVQAMFDLGIVYISTPLRDPARAVRWFRNAAEEGDPDAMGYLSTCYENGFAVDKDAEAAEQWLRKAEKVRLEAAATGNPWAIARLASAYAGAGRREDALRVLQTSRHDCVRRELCAILQSGPTDEAAKWAIRLIQENPGSGQFHMLLAICHMEQGFYAEAVQELNLALKFEPDLADARMLRGIVRARLGATTEALPDLLAARDASPSSVRFRLNLAVSLQDLGRFDEAVEELVWALRVKPEAAEVRVTLLRLYMQLRRLKDAAALIVDGESEPGLAGYKDWLVNAALACGMTSQLDKAFDYAYRSFRFDLRLFPYATETLSRLLQHPNGPTTVLARSDAMLAVLARVEADEGARAAMPDPVHQAALRALRGRAFAAIHRSSQAAEEFNAAFLLAEQSKNEAAAAGIGQLALRTMGPEWVLEQLSSRGAQCWLLAVSEAYVREKDIPQAVRIADLLMEETTLVSCRSLALRAAASIYYLAGQEDVALLEKSLNAERAQLAILENDPGAALGTLVSLNNIANMLVEHPVSRDPREALRYSRRAYDLVKTAGLPGAEVMDTHGWILIQCGQLEEGVRVLEEALIKDDVPDVYYHLGRACLIRKQPAEALAQFAKARESIESRKRRSINSSPGLEAQIEKAVKEAQEMAQRSLEP